MICSSGMVSIFMSSEGISCPAVFLTHKADISGAFYMASLYMFKNVGFHFCGGKTIQALPLAVFQLFHLGSDEVVQI